MYKEISIPIENDCLVEKNKIINLFSSFFNDEFSFDFSENIAEIQLAALDYTMFQHTVSKILCNGALNEESKKVVQDILDSIISIKSYGLKGGKRVYVDYNNERKVQNRKEKEKKDSSFIIQKVIIFPRLITIYQRNMKTK